jgi:hypothetical protein
MAEEAWGISPRASHRSGLDTLASSGSCHRAKAAAFRRELELLLLPVGSLPTPVASPFAPRALPRFNTTTGQSAPLRRISTFGLAVGCDSAPNRDPFDFLSHPSDFLRKSQIWRGPDRRREGPRRYGSFDLEINIIGKFRVGSRFGAETQSTPDAYIALADPPALASKGAR